jgi:hypothetical protein
MDGVQFHCGSDIEACLLKSEAETARTGEEVDPYGA